METEETAREIDFLWNLFVSCRVILEYDCQIRKLFEYYTDDQEALRIAEVVTELLTSIEVERAVENELYFDLVQRLSAIQNDK